MNVSSRPPSAQAQAGDLGQAAGDQRGAGALAEAQAVADAGRDGDDVLHRAADLHAR